MKVNLRLLMCSQFGLGLELPVSIAFVYISPLLLHVGFSELQSSLVLCLSSVIGLLLSPLIGVLSDILWTPVGRRRPFIVVLGTIVSITLLFIPRCYHQAWLLCILVVMLDSCSQICLGPYESLLADLFEHPFGMYSMMLNLGSVLGYSFVIIDWKSIIMQLETTTDIKISFGAILGIFIVSLTAAMLFSKETRPKQAQSLSGSAFICHSLRKIINVPSQVRWLLLCDGLTWASILCFKYFFSDFYIRHVLVSNNDNRSRYDANSTEISQVTHFEAGLKLASQPLLGQSVIASILSIFTNRIAKRMQIRTLYALGMISFGISVGTLASGIVSHHAAVIALLSVSGVGCMTATSVPFLLLQRYHKTKGHNDWRCIGADIGLLDSCYFLCQVILFALVGFAYRVSVRLTMVTSSLLAFVSCFPIYMLSIETTRLNEDKTHETVTLDASQ